MENFDLIIVGGGPAGLTAGIYAGRSRLETLILEEKTSGGEAAITPWIENYPGFVYISGAELTEKLTGHCRKFGAQLNQLEKVTFLDLGETNKMVKTNNDTYLAPAIIIATGTHNRQLKVPGEKEFHGKGVSYCALCDGAFFKGKRIIVAGGGNSAAKSALYLSNIASNVQLVHRKSHLRAEAADVENLKKQNVEFLWNSEIKEIKGDNVVKSVMLRNNKTGKKRKIEVDGLFVQIGEVPNSLFVKEAGVKVDEAGYVVVDARQRTNVPGVFAAGDVANGPVKQIGTAVGQAIVAASEAFEYVKRPYYHKADE